MIPSRPLHLFEGYGIELEYMIVDAESLDVKPIADEILKQMGGGYELEVDLGKVAWSNELALHVIEMKANGPAPALSPLVELFQQHVGEINSLLAPRGARLLPGGMHPWMHPDRELRLWPHEDNVIYRTFDRIFNCKGHGWANLQSTHINLPFANDDEFGRLHAAIRLVLPLLPALAASSPFIEGRRSGFLDTRVEVYRTNAKACPAVVGEVIPEAVFSQADYQQQILDPIYAALKPLDPDGVLRHEWSNARGAIARFNRMAIEIRLLDIQECPAADLAVAAIVTNVVHALVDGHLSPLTEQKAWSEVDLARMLRATLKDGEQTLIDNPGYLRALGLDDPSPARAGELWQRLAEQTARPETQALLAPFLGVYATQGTLASRLIAATGSDANQQRLTRTYQSLSECLAAGELFVPES